MLVAIQVFSELLCITPLLQVGLAFLELIRHGSEECRRIGDFAFWEEP